MHTLIGPFLLWNSNCSHALFQICCVLAQLGLRLQGIATRYHNDFDTSLVSGMHILKKVYYMMTSFPAIYFSIIRSLFHGSTWSDPYDKDTLFISQHLLQQSIITSSLWLIREKTEGYVYLRKTIVALWICNHWINLLIRLLKDQKMVSMGMPLQTVKQVPQVGFIWVVKTKDTYHLQSWRQLAFQQILKCYYNIMICTDTDNYVNI